MTNTNFRATFYVKGLPKLRNQISRSWRASAGERKKWHNLVLRFGGHLAPPKPLLKAKLTLSRFSSEQPDFDGLVSGFKYVIDGLIKAGFIEDDNQDIIGQPRYLWFKAPRRQGKIKITIKESKDGSKRNNR